MSGSARVASLDVLRGVALLGILLMNIQSFAMIEAAYFNPTAYGDLSGANYWVWYLSRLLVDSKFMAIFSMLFGASMLLILDKAEARGQRPLAVHARRNVFLLLVGAAHAYLFWFGDILLHYALCSFVVFFFRRRAPVTLLIAGIAFLLMGSLLSVLGGMQPDSPALREEIAAFNPSPARVAAELAVYRGGWLEQMPARVESALGMHLVVLPFYFLWRVSGMMLIGMALYRWGVLSALRSDRFYMLLLVLGAMIGLPLVHYGVVLSERSDWDYLATFFAAAPYNYWGSIPVALAWVGAVMLLCRRGALPALTAPLASVGRMAFSNYLLQTLIATTFFYGHGFGRFGYLDRTEQLLFVLVVWLMQLQLSTWWLKRYRYGPAEWVWRRATTGAWPALAVVDR